MAPLLEIRDISKSYGPVQANREISLQLQAGRIHALVGENGAGKSTLMKILFGLEKADAGQIFFKGQEVRINNPRAAKRLGLGMIHQHFQLAPGLTALEHILLEEETGAASLLRPLDRRGWLARMQGLSEKFGLPVPWELNTDRLSVGVQQRVEILKLLAFHAQILILDEPTAVLTPIEVEQFLDRLRELKGEGKTIVLITHKLQEVMAVADDVSVLRRGQIVSSGTLAGETAQTLASKMVGENFKPRPLQRVAVENRPLLQVENLSGRNQGDRDVLGPVSFQLRSGEIFGVAGVEGNGQSELIQALALPRDSKIKWQGRITLRDKDLLDLHADQIRETGLSLIPEDRLHQAVVPSLTAKENFQLGRRDLTKSFWIKEKERDQQIDRAIRDFAVTPARPNMAFANFSGGNQQKLVVARELGAKPKFLIAAQPTRGVDIGAIERIHEAIMHARNTGVGILLISSELEELLRLSDRLVVMCKGRIEAELPRTDFDMKKIGRLMGGAQ